MNWNKEKLEKFNSNKNLVVSFNYYITNQLRNTLYLRLTISENNNENSVLANSNKTGLIWY